MTWRAKPVPCIVLLSREQYRSCHIRVPDQEQPLAAIWLGDRYFSFFQALSDSKRALGLVIKLSHRGDAAAITPIAKGYAIWIWESDATLVTRHQAISPNLPRLVEPAFCKLLVSQDQYKKLEIHVPDLEQSILAIQTDGQYYSIFRVESQVEKVLEIVAKITLRGDETAIARMDAGYAICIWEPEAYPIKSAS
jgi:hypothetical protein